MLQPETTTTACKQPVYHLFKPECIPNASRAASARPNATLRPSTTTTARHHPTHRPCIPGCSNTSQTRVEHHQQRPRPTSMTQRDTTTLHDDRSPPSSRPPSLHAQRCPKRISSITTTTTKRDLLKTHEHLQRSRHPNTDIPNLTPLPALGTSPKDHLPTPRTIPSLSPSVTLSSPGVRTT
jgi:hypothetical protein